ncbi:hypothetical protein H072_1424 [Dactylellina haptotyla CBS 200.50]|uniref:DUF6604 domain-containing protein n=1 Tax=Dactylellina haptotyla (strain CBS 200.50) TaxID=1284197 RepID=S8CA69_DACHA|nr:hypothetical protein H072_1424 [Dactylellina haptotyla CBS 200.50]
MGTLPESIFDTYKRYKNGTNYIIAWIWQNGHVQESNNHPSKSKGKKPKARATKKAVESQIKLQDLIGLAKAAFNKNIKPPEGFMYILNDVINARSRCAKWYRLQYTSDSHRSHQSHEHFIQILKDIYGIFKLMETIPDAKETKLGNMDKETAETPKLANLYEYLEHEKPLDGKSKCYASDYFATERRPGKPQLTFKQEESILEEQLFALFCYFKDSAKIRKFIGEVWDDYAKGKSSLTAAAMTTNAAFGLLRQANEDLAASFPGMDDHSQVISFFESNGFPIIKHKQNGPNNDEKPKSGPPVHPRGPLEDDPDILALPSMLCVDIWTVVLESRIKLGLSYPPRQSAQDDMHLSFAKEAEIADTLAMEYLIFSQVLQDTVKYQITLGFEKAKESGEVIKFPSWLVIAFDIVHNLGWILWQEGIDQPYRELQTFLGSTIEQFDRTMAFSNTWHELGLPQLESHATHAKQFLDIISSTMLEWVNGDIIGSFKGPPGDEAYTTEKKFLLRHDPVFVGLLMSEFKLLIYVQGLGMAIQDQILTICAHAYNAGRVAGILQQEWQDMEDLIAIHALDNSIFVGDRPIKNKMCANSMYVSTGWSIRSRAKGKSFSQMMEEYSSNKRIGRPAAGITKMIRNTSAYIKAINKRTALPPRMVHSRRNRSNRRHALSEFRCPSNLTALLPDIIGEQIQRYENLKKRGLLTEFQDPALDGDIIAQWHKYGKVDQLQMLEVFYKSIACDDFHFSFNYFSMVERCTTLLRQLLAGGPTNGDYLPSITRFFSRPTLDLMDALTFLGGSIEMWGNNDEPQLLQIVCNAMSPMIKQEGSIERIRNQSLKHKERRHVEYIDIKVLKNLRNTSPDDLSEYDVMVMHLLLDISAKAFTQVMGIRPQEIFYEDFTETMMVVGRTADQWIDKINSNAIVNASMSLREKTLWCICFSLKLNRGSELRLKKKALLMATRPDLFPDAYLEEITKGFPAKTMDDLKEVGHESDDMGVFNLRNLRKILEELEDADLLNPVINRC